MSLDKKFREIFGVQFLQVYDVELARLGYGAHLDVVEFDAYLKRTFDDYTDGMSMDEFVKIKFGDKAAKFIDKLI